MPSSPLHPWPAYTVIMRVGQQQWCAVVKAPDLGTACVYAGSRVRRHRAIGNPLLAENITDIHATLR
jgi:hypothetical protein